MNSPAELPAEVTAPTALVTIDPKNYVAQVYEPFDKRLSAAVAEVEGITYDIATKDGMQTAKSARALLRAIRTDCEKERAARKAPILEIGKLLDSRAKEIEAQVRPLEARFDDDIKAEEKRIEEEKAAKLKAEAERAAAIQRNMDEITGAPLASMTKSAEAIKDRIAELEQQVPTEADFGERVVEAEFAIKAAIDQMKPILEGKIAQEELARIQAEQAAQAAAAEAKAKAEREAEEARMREEQAKETARLKAEREEFERQKAEFEAQQAEAEAKEKAAMIAQQNRQLDKLEDEMLAAQEAKKNTPQSEAVTHDGARPAAVSQMEPAAPVADVVQIRDKPKNPNKPRAVIMGEIEVVEQDGDNFKTPLGLLIVFNTTEELRTALNSGVCEFSVFGERVAA